MQNQFKDLFISYGRRESLGFVARLHQRLKLAGYDGWFDKVNIPDGDDYAQRINHGIESAHNFVYVMARRCMTSPYCLIELEYARLLGKRIIPINQMVIFDTPEKQLSAGDQQVLVNFYKSYNLPDQNIHTTKDVLNRSHALVGTTDWLDAKQNLSDEDCQNLVEWAQPYENNWAKHDDLEYLKTAKLPVFGEIIDAIEGVVERIAAVVDRETDYVHRHSEILADALHWQKNQKASVHLLVGKERTAAELWLLTEFLPPKQPPCQASTLVCEFICEARKNAENLMTDIFICYDIQHDKAIRDNVIQSLSRYAKTTWTHDRDIQKGADYEGVIDVGIENADNFFYFISPSSVASEYCQRELAHALQYNKRIVPLLIVPTSNIPKPLRKLQYIDLTENTSEDDYDSHIDEILNILRQDEEYYKQHKVLLARAIKWQTKNQKPSFLLRGHNLDNAKTWLRLNDKREQHPPLPLHQQLITASEAAKGQLSTDIFISYSRKDSDFARRLNTALQEAGKTTWFDQESISTGVDFENEIFKGINGTDNFLFVLSPDSVESEYCESEVNHAASQNKRFISILHRETEPTTQPEALRKINWIDFKDSTFDKSFPELVQAIELDREHANQHTLLQQRATDWDENNQSSDFLLNTTACSNAEQWLQTAKAKQPEPTESQQEFIQQSRQAIVAAESAVSKRRKITFAAITIGMIFAIFLSVFAFMQMNTSNENLQAAKARLYHAKAQVLSETDAPLALRLAEKAREFDPLDETIDKTLQDIYAHGDLDLSSLPYGGSSSTVIPYRERNNLLLATSKIGAENTVLDEQHIVKKASKWGDVQKPLVTTLGGHQSFVNSVEFSSDGSLIVTASKDKTAKVWDVQGKLLATLSGHQDALQMAAFSPDGALIVTASDDKTAKVWDVQGKLLATLSGHQDALKTVAFSPDGTSIVTASKDETAKVWDVQGKLQTTLSGHSNWVNSAAFSPEGTLIVTASGDKTVRVWNIQGKLLSTLSGHQDALRTAAFSPDGTLIVTAADKTAKVWDVQGKLLATLSGHQKFIYSAVFSPDGALIVTASDDKTAKVWNVQGKLLATLSGHQDTVFSAAFSPDGASIVTASADKTAKVWDVQGKLLTTLNGHSSYVFSALFSPNGASIVTASWDNTAKVWDKIPSEWDVQRPLLITISGHQDDVKSAAFSPYGASIVTASKDKTAKVWDVEGKLLATLSGHSNWVNSATFSPDGVLIVTASGDKTAKVWDVQGKLLTTLSGHQGGLYSAAFSPDGTLIVTAADKTAKVWDVQGKLLATLSGSSGFKSAAFSPDGALIVTARSGNYSAQMWDVQGNLIKALNGNFYAASFWNCWVKTATFSPDGASIVGALGNTAKVFDIVKGKLLTSLNGHSHWVSSAAYSPDGNLIITASYDKTAKVWNVDGKLLATLSGHSDWVSSAAFSPDGSLIVTASGDKTAKVWNRWKMQGQLPITSKGVYAEVNSVLAFSPEQQRIITASDDNTAKVWNMLGKLLATFEHQEKVKFARFSPDGSQIKTITKNTVNLWRNDSFVDDFLKSNHLVKLTVVDKIFSEVLTIEELSGIEVISDDLENIAKFYKNKADQSYITEIKRKYLLQAAMLYQKSNVNMGQLIKLEIANLDRPSSISTNYKELEPTLLESQPIVMTTLVNIPLIIFLGFLMLIVSRHQKFFFQNQQYLQLIIYSIVIVVVLVGWFSFRDNWSIYLQEVTKYFWLIDVVMAVFIVGIYFFPEHLQRKVFSTLHRIMDLFVFGFLSSSLFVYLLCQMTTMKESDILTLVSVSFMAEFFLIPIPMTYYNLRPCKWWTAADKWSKVQNSMPITYIWLFSITLIPILFFDSTIAFYNPIPTNLRFLLLLVAVIVLIPAIWSQFYIYLLPQKKWLTMLGFAGVYSSILYLSLIAFWNSSTFTTFVLQRVVFYYEISDVLTLLLALTAASFAIIWAINGYRTQNYIKSGVYSLLALFLVSSSIFYFRAYMSILPFFAVVIGGMLLFIHSVSTGFDKKPQSVIDGYRGNYIKIGVHLLLVLFVVSSYFLYFREHISPFWNMMIGLLLLSSFTTLKYQLTNKSLLTKVLSLAFLIIAFWMLFIMTSF